MLASKPGSRFITFVTSVPTLIDEVAVAHAVKHCVEKNCALSDLTLAELIKACGLSPKSKLITQEVFAVLTPKGSVNARNHVGGTAPKQVLAAIKRAHTGLRKK